MAVAPVAGHGDRVSHRHRKHGLSSAGSGIRRPADIRSSPSWQEAGEPSSRRQPWRYPLRRQTEDHGGQANRIRKPAAGHGTAGSAPTDAGADERPRTTRVSPDAVPRAGQALSQHLARRPCRLRNARGEANYSLPQKLPPGPEPQPAAPTDDERKPSRHQHVKFPLRRACRGAPEDDFRSPDSASAHHYSHPDGGQRGPGRRPTSERLSDTLDAPVDPTTPTG